MSEQKQHANDQLLAASEIVRNHTIYSMGGSLIPVPLLDLAAVTAIQLDMVKQLSNLFGADYSENSGKTLVGALTGNVFARLGASLIKSIPGIGSILGGVSLVALSGAATYALGNVYVKHVSEGGSLSDLNAEDYKEFFRERFEEGKKKAAEWKEQAESAAEEAAREIEVEFKEEEAAEDEGKEDKKD